MQELLSKMTVARLSRYRRFLAQYRYLALPHIFSHDLAKLVNVHPVQVRRDLMLIGFSGNHRKGYNVNQLIELIDDTLEHGRLRKLAIIGFGKLGRSVLQFLGEHDHNFSVEAIFDIDRKLTGHEYSGVPCFHIEEMTSVIHGKEIEIAILTLPDGEDVREIARIISGEGITGILNFTSEKLEISGNVYVKDSDLFIALDEVSYFASDKR